MAENYTGRQYTVTLGTKDQSSQAIGTATVANVASHIFRVNSPVSDIAFDGGFQTSDVRRAGRRMMTAEDRFQQYGHGEWTWDFDWIVENEAVAQVLLKAIGNGQTTTTSMVFNESNLAPAQLYIHGAGGSTDVSCNIIINNPDADEDRVMHSAILQNLGISMDVGTDAGRVHMTGQFMTGYKPVIGTDSTSPATTNADWTNGIFDLTTMTIGGHAVTLKSFNINLENPASRVGFQGTSGETDGYSRGGDVNVTGSATIKVDATSVTYLDDWIANTNTAIVMESGSSWSIAVGAAKITGHNNDWGDEGAFVEIPFVGTTGANGATDLCTIKIT